MEEGWPDDHQVESLVARFIARTLPKSEWTHRAHLVVGLWHVHRHGLPEAIDLLRSRITLLNEAHGTLNTDTSGYHETVTRAYAILLSQFLATTGREASLASSAQALLASPLASRDALRTYYTEAALFSHDARKQWVEPDLAALCDGSPCTPAVAPAALPPPLRGAP